VLIARAGSYRQPSGEVVPVDRRQPWLAVTANERLAAAGQRVMVVAQRDFDPATFDPGADLIEQVRDLTLLAMVGIVDPPRPEAKAAIAECRSAGVRVRMITGDHVTTAAAIAQELGIEGRALTGSEFANLSDDELLRQLPQIGVIARVAPEDKLRLVRLLKESGQVVAMTGDGVNDAPGAEGGRHRRGHGHHRHGGLQGGRRHDSHRRQLRHHRQGGRLRPRSLRQPGQVPAVPDVHPGRLHRGVPRGRGLRHRERRPAEPAADPLAQHGDRHPDRDRARVRRALARADGP
jgi:hypothetical protein